MSDGQALGWDSLAQGIGALAWTGHDHFAVVLLPIRAVDEVGVPDLRHAGRQVAVDRAVLRRRQLDRAADRFDLDRSIDDVDDSHSLKDVRRRIVALLGRHANLVLRECLSLLA
jgi:uncharacterized membrane protein YdbT with pleckstrin-like domain